ncbi:caspase domain-containing protein [Nemania abortiva]|nr:caspase domain-containing protein [Nemania abortiva]
MDFGRAINYFAILIGINTYPKQPLQGCIRDVQTIKGLLEDSLEYVNVKLLTSDLAQNPQLWPTHQNVVSAFQEVTSLARPGDLVYIHFSGHGTREPPNRLKAFSNPATGDLALVLLRDASEHEVRYLYGEELAYCLKTMVDKKLLVTIVLDCCFSGSAVRKDDSVRFLPYDSKIAAAYVPIPGKTLGEKATRSVHRDAAMLPSWLVNPNGYTIFAACGPRELAREIRDEQKQKRGVLSYFLSRYLRNLHHLGINQREVYSHLSVSMREYSRNSGRQQTPMLYGSRHLGFLGTREMTRRSAAVSILKVSDGVLQLQAGEAHGVSTEDKFELYSWKSVKDPKPVIAKVTKVGALVSDLEVLEGLPSIVGTGWGAKSLTCHALRKFPVCLAGISPSALDKWKGAMNERLALRLYNGDDLECTPAFYIEKNDDFSHTMRGEAQQQIGIIPPQGHDGDDEKTLNHTINILEHLAKYKLVAELTNRSLPDNGAFRESFNVYLANLTSKEVSVPGHIIEAKDGDIFELVVANKGSDTLHLHLYSMNSFWKIQNLIPGDYIGIPPKASSQGFRTSGTWSTKLKMSVPAEVLNSGRHSCEDILKIFLTIQATSFTMLELPALGKLPEPKKIRDPVEADSRESEDWMALDFRVLTSKD